MPKVIYTDLDGTMVGPRGCFFRSEAGAVTLRPATVLAAALEAGVALVLVSGRTRDQLVEASRVFGADGFIAELGALVGWEHGKHVSVLAGHDRAPEQLVEELIAEHRGFLEHHSPWHHGHEVDWLLRGHLDIPAAEKWLADKGFPWLGIRDNGVLPPGRSTTLDPAAMPVHVYHLMPRGISKGTAVAWDLSRRGLTAADAIAIGDSASDLEMAPHVDRFWLVANGARHAHMADLVAQHSNVTVADEGLGLGWAQAVESVLGLAGSALRTD